MNTWKSCSFRCGKMGYYSPKHDAVLCDRHFFQLNSGSPVSPLKSRLGNGLANVG